MTYKLTHQDYLNLWLFMSPEEIKARFEDGSYSSRHIYRVYHRYGLSSINQFKDEMVQKIYLKSPIFMTREEVMSIVDQQLQLGVEQVCLNIDNKIRKFE